MKRDSLNELIGTIFFLETTGRPKSLELKGLEGSIDADRRRQDTHSALLFDYSHEFLTVVFSSSAKPLSQASSENLLTIFQASSSLSRPR